MLPREPETHSEAEPNPSSCDNSPLLVREYNESEIDFSKFGWFATFRRSKTSVMIITSIALFTDMIVYGIVVPILPIIVRERLGHDASSTGFLFSCYAIGLLCATPIFAVLSDRYNTRKIPMLFGMAGLGICTLLFGISTTYWQLVVARIAQGASGGASWTISLAMLADRFGSGPKLGVVMGTVLSANTLGFMTGPIVGGMLFQYWGYTSPFIFCSVLSLFGFLAACTIIEPIYLKEWDRAINRRNGSFEELQNHDNESDSDQEVPCSRLSIFRLIQDWEVITICITLTVVSSVFSGLEPTLPIYLRDKFHANASEIGIIFISVVVPTIISPVVGWLSYRIGQRTMSGIGMIWIAIASPLIALPDKLWLEVIPLLLFGCTFSIVSTPTLPLLGQKVERNGGGAYGQIYALWNMAYSLGMFVGPVIAGITLEYYGFLTTMCMFSVISLMITPLVFLGNPFRFFIKGCGRDGYDRVPTDEE